MSVQICKTNIYDIDSYKEYFMTHKYRPLFEYGISN